MGEVITSQHQITPSLLTLLYVEKGWTLLKIADYLGCAQNTVRNYMRKHEIPSRHPTAHFKGQPSHRRGQHGMYAPETLAKMSLASKARGCRPPIDRGRHKRKLHAWRLSVFQRDAYTCQVCGQVGRSLNAHHIKHWSSWSALRFEISNGVTLCETCHRLAHQRERGKQ